MRRLRGDAAVAGGRARLGAALAASELTEQALINFMALAPFSGRSWSDRYTARPRRALPIPLQRQTRVELGRRATAARVAGLESRLSRGEVPDVRSR